MDQALFEIYERNFPFNIRKKDTVLQILGHRDNVVLERTETGESVHSFWKNPSSWSGSGVLARS